MDNRKLKLYVGADHISAFAMSAFVALKEKKLSFELVTVDLKARENYLTTYRESFADLQDSNAGSRRFCLVGIIGDCRIPR